MEIKYTQEMKRMLSNIDLHISSKVCLSVTNNIYTEKINMSTIITRDLLQHIHLYVTVYMS